MLVEIPDPEVILGIIVAFLGGLFVLYLFYKFKSLLQSHGKLGSFDLERLEFYEKQLIDMKIRLDSLDFSSSGTELVDSNQLKQISTQYRRTQQKGGNEVVERPSLVHKRTKIDQTNTVDFVLGLITHKPMTSRDIQIASRRSREHTSRLMNKLFKEGYVVRNTKTKPYTYSITDKGRVKLGILEYLQETAA